MSEKDERKFDTFYDSSAGAIDSSTMDNPTAAGKKKLPSGKCTNCKSGKHVWYCSPIPPFKREYCKACKPKHYISWTNATKLIIDTIV